MHFVEISTIAVKAECCNPFLNLSLKEVKIVFLFSTTSSIEANDF